MLTIVKKGKQMIPLQQLRNAFASYPSGVEEAVCIAAAAHCYQRNKFNNEPYLMHVFRVMSRLQVEMTAHGKQDDDLLITAALHDTIEDTAVTLQFLRESGFQERIVEAVDSVTRRDGETYTNFIRRANENRIGRLVKIADLEDHLSRKEPRQGMHARYGLHLEWMLQN